MTNRKFTEEFKEEAVKQIKERGYKVSEVSKRFGASTYSLYKWLKQARENNGRHSKDHAVALRQENLRIKNELKRLEEERKSYRSVLYKSLRVRYALLFGEGSRETL